jgi:hypothetical protein
MTMSLTAVPSSKYDPRWFIWTIVFLLVTDVSLVTYIMLSNTADEDFAPVAAAQHQRK